LQLRHVLDKPVDSLSEIVKIEKLKSPTSHWQSTICARRLKEALVALVTEMTIPFYFESEAGPAEMVDS
jgi:hypothetical protein